MSDTVCTPSTVLELVPRAEACETLSPLCSGTASVVEAVLAPESATVVSLEPSGIGAVDLVPEPGSVEEA